MNHRRLLIAFILLLLVAAGCQAKPQADGPPSDSSVDEDQAQIIQLSLERALVDQEIPDYSLLVSEGKAVVLSTENIDLEEAPTVAGHELVLLTPDEIQAKANEEGDFLHLRFGPFETEDEDTVNVSLGNVWATAEDSTTGYLSGGGFELVYKRLPDGWRGEVVAAWMS